MGVKLQTTDVYKEKVFQKYGDKVEILSEYLGGTEPIDFVYHCDKHGDTYKALNAKNILARSFQPCKKCDLELKSYKAKIAIKDKNLQFIRLQEYCELMGGKLISTEWTTAKDSYEIKCGDLDHPPFFAIADSLLNKPQWCPYCSGRKGRFEEEIKEIIQSKNGVLLDHYSGSTNHVGVKCNIHNYIWDIMPLNIKKGRWCPVCSLPYSEKVPYDYFINNNYNVRVQFGFDDLLGENNEPLRYDFAILDKYNFLVGLVEIDDEEHRHNHTQPRRVKARQRDRIKDKYCLDNNIPLFRLDYYVYKKEYKDYDWYYDYIDRELKDFLAEITFKILA